MKPNILEVKDFSLSYGHTKAVRNVNVSFREKEITAIIGPSGCGKSSLLRCFNRMNDFIEGFDFHGEVLFRGKNIYSEAINPIDLRRQIGMVFQKPNPFPKTIYNNIVWGPKVNFYKDDLDELVETSLRSAALWDEVKDRLHTPANALSGGQQQRLCIARALAMEPEVLLMDEPCSALDPIASEKIEDLILSLKEKYTVLIVTHNMQQAARISDSTLFFYNGELIEAGATHQIFQLPKIQRTRDYVSGQFG